MRLQNIFRNILSVIREKDESQNGGNKKAKVAKFSEKQTFLSFQGLRNVRFRKIWCALHSCYLQFEIRLFALLPTICPFG